jgi:hypothetical protein
MIQGSSRLGFLLETAQAVAVLGKSSRQDFDGHVPSQDSIASAIDFAHSAGTDGRNDLVGPQFRTRA